MKKPLDARQRSRNGEQDTAVCEAGIRAFMVHLGS
jgi:hypothetical protein